MASGNIRNTLSSIDYPVVSSYFEPKFDLFKGNTTAQLIYKIMAPFYELCGMQIPQPLIKKYKNCLYFG